MLTLKSFLRLAGTIFFIVGLLHLVRLVTGIELIFGTQSVPLWISVIGVLLPWYLSYTAFTLANKSGRGPVVKPAKRARRRR